MYAEYGTALVGAAWAVGEWLWLRQSTGPVLAQVTDTPHGLAEVWPLGAEMPMRVPLERVAWTWVEAVSA